MVGTPRITKPKAASPSGVALITSATTNKARPKSNKAPAASRNGRHLEPLRLERSVTAADSLN
jgi:hypothetical protein